MIKKKSAFTMIELVFVIVILGILASVAIPRLAATRDDAELTKAKTVVASVRNALAMERQKRILRGDFKKITAVGGNLSGTDTYVFGNFFVGSPAVDTGVPVMEYPIISEAGKQNKWSYNSGNQQYIFKSILGDTAFIVNSRGKFVCVDENSDGCKTLTK